MGREQFNPAHISCSIRVRIVYELKKISNTLKKSREVMTKIHSGSIINAALAKRVTCDAILLY